MKIDRELRTRRPEVLDYFRNRGKEIITNLQDTLGQRQYKEISQALQPEIKASRDAAVKSLEQAGKREAWPKDVLLENILLIHHCANIVMLEARNSVWPYEYMSFSRRIGEIWGAFCALCFEYPINADLILEVPPVFAEVRDRLKDQVTVYISRLPLSDGQKKELLQYYNKVWLLVDAGEIKLELDLHFSIVKQHYNVDFKSGFGSNEKGNTNRLLVVASIYKNILDATYKNLILVRSKEEETNHYLQTLKRSSVWDVFCGDEAYRVIAQLSGFDLGTWIQKNISWEKDLERETYEHLHTNDLMKYLIW